LNKDFPTEKDLKAAFDAANEEKTGHLSIENVRSILHFLDKSITDKEISDVLGSLSLSKTDTVTFEEFKQIFGMDEESAAAQ
jgi:Ca2+-binding EF-hand superfamily protein